MKLSLVKRLLMVAMLVLSTVVVYGQDFNGDWKGNIVVDRKSVV